MPNSIIQYIFQPLTMTSTGKYIAEIEPENIASKNGNGGTQKKRQRDNLFIIIP